MAILYNYIQSQKYFSFVSKEFFFEGKGFKSYHAMNTSLNMLLRKIGNLFAFVKAIIRVGPLSHINIFTQDVFF